MPAPNAKPLADRAAAKRQAVTTVSAIALVFILWPERFIIWRNLCFVPVAAWLTALVFDLKHGALDAWDDRVPAWMKRFIGADDSSSSYNNSRSSGAGAGARYGSSRAKSTTMPEYVLMHLGDTVSLVKKEAARIWETVSPILTEWFRQVIHFLTPQTSANRMPSPTSSPRKPSPEFTQYYGILVKLPRGPNVTAPFAPPFRMREASDRIIPRESKDASAVPSVLSSWDVDSRISFLLVEKTTWDDRDLTLRSKLAAGTYWNMSAQGRGNLRREMDRTEVAQISGIEVIGLGDGEYDALKKCRQCFRVLCQDWKYMRMLWDDVDFAAILAFLVMGPSTATKSAQIYRALCMLRADQAEVPKRGGPTIDSFLIAAATGGLAAPFVLPLMAGGLAAAAMRNRNGALPEQRRKAYKSLMMQFPELKALFDAEEREHKEEAIRKDCADEDEEWKDEGEDYYNDALNPFDW
ncbi:hypothetical protein TRIATDRAFT_32766 [Trichoderma atroviride IMI 206040]|uniref:Uncharacterized protein n=1 Tax=Hypocrea atroviridis (strain ATCC 20476 / IMI 206040) TaxID=452589 RepID=G9P2Y5_HYPAI|nr:uncharacterized protein TRIATDRAFT_32766 [Trichoderma atroviride IMI 206040]EHK42759.1 hypothetical protein TRIATDRAFT_32766 [Trichoderma atroviride IMI 206040]